MAEFRAFCGRQGVEAVARIDRRLARAWLCELQGRGLKRNSVLRKVSSVRSFCAWLIESETLRLDPFLGLASPRKEKRLPRFLTEVEMDSILDKGGRWAPRRKRPELPLRDRALLEFLYSTAVRRSEASALNTADVDAVGGTVRVFGKGSRERVVAVGNAALEALRDYLESRRRARPGARLGGGEPLFTNHRGGRLSPDGVALVVRRWARAAGLLKPLAPHMLRHSCATHMADRGADLRVVQEQLGHKSINNTQIYTHLSLEHIRKVYEKSHPRASR